MSGCEVAMVCLYPPPGLRHAGRSGVASYTANLVEALSDQGSKVTVVAQREPDEGSAEVAGGNEAGVVRAFERGPWALIDASRAAIRTGAPVVHIQFELFLYGGVSALAGLLPALMMLRRARRRVVVTIHQVVDPRAVDRRFVRNHRVRAPVAAARMGIALVQGALRRRSDAVIVHEHAFSEVFGSSRVIPHGVESLPRTNRDRARSQLGLGGRPVVLCFGFVAPYKGLESALAAAESSGGAFELVVAGGSHPRFGPGDSYFADLRERWGKVARFTGYVPEAEVPAWFSASDVALYPYPRPFSASGALALALAHGTPVLLSEPLSGFMRAPEGLTVPNSPERLASTLTSLLTDSGRLEDVRRDSRRLADGRRWPEVARMHRELYREVTDAHGFARRSVRAG